MRKSLREAYFKKRVFLKSVQNRPERAIKRTNNSDQKYWASGSSRTVPGGLRSKIARRPSFSRVTWRKSHRNKRDHYLVVVVVVVPTSRISDGEVPTSRISDGGVFEHLST